jgi:hypothetical protein
LEFTTFKLSSPVYEYLEIINVYPSTIFTFVSGFRQLSFSLLNSKIYVSDKTSILYHTSGIKFGSENFAWIWSSTGVFQNCERWAVGEPVESRELQTAIQMQNGSLYSDTTHKLAAFICEEKRCPTCP